MVTRRYGWLRGAGALVLLGLTCSALLAHNGEIPPQPPPVGPPPPYAEVNRIYPVRWSWLHWWEANRDAYLLLARQGKPQRIDPEVLAKYRSSAVEALLAALKSDLVPLRMSAAVALGRIGEPRALPPLSELALKDPVPDVSLLSIIAIGLLDTPEGEKFLVTMPGGDSTRREAILCALGLMSNSSPDVIPNLQAAVNGRDPGQAAIAAWALSRKADPANVKFLQGALSRTLSAWVASESLLSLGRQGQADSAEGLAEVLLGPAPGRSFPAWKELEDRRNQIAAALAWNQSQRAQYERAYADYVRRLNDWNALYNPNAAPLGPAAVNPNTVHLVAGLEEIYMARLQGSAAVALGHIDSPVSRKALLKCLEAREDGYCQIYKQFAMMSLGELGEPAALPVLTELLSATNPSGGRKSQDKLKLPTRGFAALALGLYARAVQTPQGPEDRPDYDKACLALASRIADAAEEAEVRAACAVALGLTARTENLRYLQAASKAVTDRDDLLAGFMLMGRGMLGDKNILEPAKKYLSPANEKQDTSGILGRRAAIMGLAMMDSQEAIPVLLEARSLGYHSNRELCVALAICGAYNVTDRLVKLMKEDPYPWERAFAARCLGEIFVSERPQKLARFLNDSNFTLKNSRLTRYQALANEFLYIYLLPAFGNEWR